VREMLTISELQKGYRDKSFCIKEIIEEYLERIDQFDGKIGAFLTVCGDTALKEAEVLDEKLGRGEDIGPLGGIPVAVKDNICTRGIKTTCASKMLEDFIPPYDATVIKKLRDAGAVIIGKTNMDEFAMGSSTETSAFRVTHNPWDLNKVTGGSSGGSAAAVAAGFAPLAVGSDTGGSIRQPAAFCGAVGLKPTYGAVSRYGLIAFASSLDQIGPISATVQDCVLAFQVMRGQDSFDSTSVAAKTDTDYAGAMEDLEKGVQGLKIGLPKECFHQGLDPEIGEAILASARLFEKLGARVEEISLPVLDSGFSAYYIISSAEASSNLARYDGVRYGCRTESFRDIDELIMNTRTEGFGEEVKRRIMLGTFVLSSGYYDAFYNKAMLLRLKIRNAFQNIFQRYDLLLMPTSPILPYDIGVKRSNPLEMYLSDIYTATMNIAGIPAISLPCGFSRSGLPIGLQLAADHYREDMLFRAAFSLERELGISGVRPGLEEVQQYV
jgi:aspartyl-tRNA(Asn)/glutamyl-tRNA(Gln) amidotransferase subunit A